MKYYHYHSLLFLIKFYRITVESIASNKSNNDDHDTAVWVSALNLVDLAGSESVRNTGNTGQKAKEGGKINQSLLSLGRVIQELSQPGSHISFRNSKLTHLLQPSLSGNAKMSVVCCVTPSDRYYSHHHFIALYFFLFIFFLTFLSSLS